MKTLTTLALSGLLLAVAAPAEAQHKEPQPPHRRHLKKKVKKKPAPKCCVIKVTAGHFRVERRRVRVPGRHVFHYQRTKVAGYHKVTVENVKIPGYHKEYTEQVKTADKWVAEKCTHPLKKIYRIGRRGHKRVIGTQKCQAKHKLTKIPGKVQTVTRKKWIPERIERREVKVWVPPTVRIERLKVWQKAWLEVRNVRVWIPMKTVVICAERIEEMRRLRRARKKAHPGKRIKRRARIRRR